MLNIPQYFFIISITNYLKIGRLTPKTSRYGNNTQIINKTGHIINKKLGGMIASWLVCLAPGLSGSKAG